MPRVALLLSLSLLAVRLPAAAADGGSDFFESRIRPVLAEHCYKCHSDRTISPRGGLRLDSAAAILRGGSGGKVVVPGVPEKSLLLRSVRHDDPDLKMPPGQKLPEAVLADLERWIRLGVPMPGKAALGKLGPGEIDFDRAAQHWAFRPVAAPTPPMVRDGAWPVSPLDAFVLARLEAAGLSPSLPADRRTLLRRACFVLTGLPPTLEEIEAFEKDAAPNAFEKVVDRLLASPHYGERWARHWLDVARYADTKDGVLMYGADRIRPYAYTYRDYVNRAFNEDLPFARFVHDQIAADLLEPKGEPWRLAAMGFLTLGRMFDNNVHDVIDDRIDTVTRGFLGLTVACARCHDHKYDPVPTADYYSLHGIFASCSAPLELPLLEPPTTPEAVAFEKQAAPKREALRRFLDDRYAQLSETARRRVGDYLVHVATTPPDPLETAIFFLSLAPEDLRPPIVHRWRTLLRERSRPDDPVFGPWQDLMALASDEFAARAPQVLKTWSTRPAGTGVSQVNPLVRAELEQAKLQSKADIARTYGNLLQRIYEESKKSPTQDSERKQLLALVAGPESPAYFPKSRTRRYMSRADTDAYGGKVRELDRMAATSPHAPPRAMVLNDGDIQDPHIFRRGNPAAPGDAVPRQFLRILAGAERKPFADGSGRLDLARAITDPDNPLTRRVLVNRVWMHHFGEPLVATPSDFGTRSTPPTHPLLLDWLADRFLQDGWSLKKLHRTILLSRTWQQAGADRPACRKVDPENRLLWRAHRRRLDLEAMRDAILLTAGRLDTTLYGRPVDIVGDPNNRRRTIYGLVDRQTLPGLFRNFDFASPDATAERRPFTIVPQQALFALNSPFLLEQAKALAGRVDPKASSAECVDRLFRLTLTRPPRDEERAAAESFLSRPVAGSGLNPRQQLAQVLLMTNEFLFVD